MMGNIVYNKSKNFAVRIIRLYKYLCENKNEFVMSKQILRCGTSIGANIAEAEASISKKDFLAKIYISFKECRETLYWLELLHETDYITNQEFDSIYADCKEIEKLLSSITKTTKNSLEKS
ncbi:MAG: four helix bundle protein [Clostridia bacterium]|nr:four helix bundle protein [Clostridia bacterium]